MIIVESLGIKLLAPVEGSAIKFGDLTKYLYCGGEMHNSSSGKC